MFLLLHVEQNVPLSFELTQYFLLINFLHCQQLRNVKRLSVIDDISN